MISVTVSELQKSLEEYGQRAVDEPVEVTHADQSRSYLVSEKFFNEMMASYRRALPIGELLDSDIALIARAKVQTAAPYDLDDIPDFETAAAK